jgi:hypothetical protein
MVLKLHSLFIASQVFCSNLFCYIFFYSIQIYSVEGCGVNLNSEGVRIQKASASGLMVLLRKLGQAYREAAKYNSKEAVALLGEFQFWRNHPPPPFRCQHAKLDLVSFLLVSVLKWIAIHGKTKHNNYCNLKSED